MPAPSSAAARGSKSLPVDVAVPSSAAAPARLTASASCGAQVSASGAASAAPSYASTRAAYFAASAAAAPTPAPITTATTLAALLLGQLRAGGQRRQRRRADPLFVRLAEDDDGGHQITFASLWSFATSSSTEATLAPALRTGGASYDVTVIAGLASTPSSASVSLFDLLLLRRHDPLQRGVALRLFPLGVGAGQRLVAHGLLADDAQVDGDDRRQPHPLLLDAGVDLARDRGALAVGGELDAGQERRLRPAEQAGQDLPDLVRVAVDGLLAEHHQVRLLLGDHRRQHARRSPARPARRRRRPRGSPVGAHRQHAAQLLPDLLGPDADGDHLARALAPLALLGQPQGGLDGVLVEGVELPARRRQVQLAAADLELLLGVREPACT